MKDEVSNLIKKAQESGSITSKQKEIILRKAHLLEDDIDEVEMILETIPTEYLDSITNDHRNISKSRVRKCPNCGAVVSDLVLKCPECGFVLQKESDESREFRTIIEEFEKRLKNELNPKVIAKELLKYNKCANQFDVDDEVKKRKVEMIRSLTVPLTKSMMIQAFEYTYSQYKATNNYKYSESGIPDAWLSKARELYGLIQSQSDLDESTLQWLKLRESVLTDKTKPFWVFTALFVGIVVFGLLGILKLDL